MATIYRPLRGRLTIQMPFSVNNRAWLHRELLLPNGVHPRWNNAAQRWELPLGCFDQLVVAAEERFSRVTVTEEIATTEKCTTSCLDASSATVPECSCVCEGDWHARGEGSRVWRRVGERLVISRSAQKYTYAVQRESITGD